MLLLALIIIIDHVRHVVVVEVGARRLLIVHLALQEVLQDLLMLAEESSRASGIVLVHVLRQHRLNELLLQL